MNEEKQITTIDGDVMSSLVLKGDLSGLQPAEKVQYYKAYCERLGLDPATQPLKILRLQGKETLYCDRSGTAQLNRLHKVSHTILSRETVSDCFVVTARASSLDGRHSESIGAVPTTGLKGEAMCNAMMKAETKAKRRSTLDLCGLGILDESELGEWSSGGDTRSIEDRQQHRELPLPNGNGHPARPTPFSAFANARKAAPAPVTPTPTPVEADSDVPDWRNVVCTFGKKNDERSPRGKQLGELSDRELAYLTNRFVTERGDAPIDAKDEEFVNGLMLRLRAIKQGQSQVRELVAANKAAEEADAIPMHHDEDGQSLPF